MARKKRVEEMVIRSLEDVVELVNRNTDVFNFRINKLAKSARRWKVLGIVAIVCAVSAAAECRKQDEELYKLSIRVQKLENKEGE